MKKKTGEDGTHAPTNLSLSLHYRTMLENYHRFLFPISYSLTDQIWGGNAALYTWSLEREGNVSHSTGPASPFVSSLRSNSTPLTILTPAMQCPTQRNTLCYLEETNSGQFVRKGDKQTPTPTPASPLCEIRLITRHVTVLCFPIFSFF